MQSPRRLVGDEYISELGILAIFAHLTWPAKRAFLGKPAANENFPDILKIPW
jgi:hypothetical protein